MITFADKNDKNQLGKMWQSIFLEDPQVVEEFFENIYNTTVTPVIKIGDENETFYHWFDHPDRWRSGLRFDSKKHP